MPGQIVGKDSNNPYQFFYYITFFTGTISMGCIFTKAISLRTWRHFKKLQTILCYLQFWDVTKQFLLLLQSDRRFSVQGHRNRLELLVYSVFLSYESYIFSCPTVMLLQLEYDFYLWFRGKNSNAIIKAILLRFKSPTAALILRMNSESGTAIK